jgi:hypothetical protein
MTTLDEIIDKYSDIDRVVKLFGILQKAGYGVRIVDDRLMVDEASYQELMRLVKDRAAR